MWYKKRQVKRLPRGRRVRNMADEQKTREQLLEEVQTLREQVAHLKAEVRQQKAVAEERAFLNGILDATPDFVGVAGLDGRAVYLNRAARRMAGMTDVESASNMCIYDYHPLWVREIFSEVVPLAIQHGVWCGETAMLAHDGQEIPVSQVLIAHRVNSEEPPRFFSTIARDISSQKRTEAELRTAKEYAETLILSSGDMIISADADRNIIEFNPAAERTFGYRKAEVLGQKVALLYADADRTESIRDILRREGRYMGEVLNRRKDGSAFPSFLSASVIRDPNGKALGVMGISRDITDRKKLERQRADFVAMLTHDIKNPLAAILGYVELLMEEEVGRHTKEEEDFLQRLKDNALTINALVGNYLDLARVEAGQLTLHKTVQKVEEILQHVVEQHSGVARRRQIVVTVQIASNLPAVVSDESALERVFTNLLRNALKFTPETGRVEIRAMRHPTENSLVVEIRDTGPGVAPEDIPFLFERYRRTKLTRHQEGTGLGLFIVKTFVEAHGGYVEVEGNLGRGACFRVALPAG